MREGKRQAAVSDADDVAWRTTPDETATYILEMLNELAALADQARLPRLAYLLNIAAEEARERGEAASSRR